MHNSHRPLNRDLSRLGCSFSVNMISKAEEQKVQPQTALYLSSLCTTMNGGTIIFTVYVVHLLREHKSFWDSSCE